MPEKETNYMICPLPPPSKNWTRQDTGSRSNDARSQRTPPLDPLSLILPYHLYDQCHPLFRCQCIPAIPSHIIFADPLSSPFSFHIRNPLDSHALEHNMVWCVSSSSPHLGHTASSALSPLLDTLSSAQSTVICHCLSLLLHCSLDYTPSFLGAWVRELPERVLGKT